MLFNPKTIVALLLLAVPAAAEDSHVRARQLTRCGKIDTCSIWDKDTRKKTELDPDTEYHYEENDGQRYVLICETTDPIDYMKAFDGYPSSGDYLDKATTKDRKGEWKFRTNILDKCEGDTKIGVGAYIEDGNLCDKELYKFKCGTSPTPRPPTPPPPTPAPPTPCYECPDGYKPQKECPRDMHDCEKCRDCPYGYFPIAECVTYWRDDCEKCFECPENSIPKKECPKDIHDCKICQECPDDFFPKPGVECPQFYGDCCFKCPPDTVPTKDCPQSKRDCEEVCKECPEDLEPIVECPKDVEKDCCFPCPEGEVPSVTCPKNEDQCECPRVPCPSDSSKTVMYRLKASKNECEDKCVKPQDFSKKLSEGFDFCPCIPGPPGADPCGTCDKPQFLQFLILETSCSGFSCNGQDKSEVRGVASAATLTYNLISKGGGGSGTASIGDIITFSSSDWGSEITISLNGGGNQEIDFHTSCSSAIIPEDKFGRLQLVGYNDNVSGFGCGFGPEDLPLV